MSEATDPGHGNSPAAWAAVVIMLVGFTVGTVAFVLAVEWLVWASAGVVVIGLIVGAVLAALGWGVRGHRYQDKAHG